MAEEARDWCVRCCSAWVFNTFANSIDEEIKYWFEDDDDDDDDEIESTRIYLENKLVSCSPQLTPARKQVRLLLTMMLQLGKASSWPNSTTNWKYLSLDESHGLSTQSEATTCFRYQNINRRSIIGAASIKHDDDTCSARQSHFARIFYGVNKRKSVSRFFLPLLPLMNCCSKWRVDRSWSAMLAGMLQLLLG